MARRPLPGVLNLGGPGAQTVAATARRAGARGNGVSQAGQAFADFFWSAPPPRRRPLALLTVMRGDRLEHTVFGAEREALEDPELFSIIAGRREPVEVTDPGSNPALVHSRLARSNLGIRWLLAIPLLGPSGDVNAIFRRPRTPSPVSFPGENGRPWWPSGAWSAVRCLLTGRRTTFPGPGGGRAHSPTSTKQTADGHSLLRSHEVAALFDVTERTVINWAASESWPACARWEATCASAART